MPVLLSSVETEKLKETS